MFPTVSVQYHCCEALSHHECARNLKKEGRVITSLNLTFRVSCMGVNGGCTHRWTTDFCYRHVSSVLYRKGSCSQSHQWKSVGFPPFDHSIISHLQGWGLAGNQWLSSSLKCVILFSGSEVIWCRYVGFWCVSTLPWSSVVSATYFFIVKIPRIICSIVSWLFSTCPTNRSNTPTARTFTQEKRSLFC